MRTLVAVDQSYKETGLAVVTMHGDVLLMESLPFKASVARVERRKEIADRVLELVREYKAECVIVEKVRLYSSQRTIGAKARREASGKGSSHISLPVIMAHSRIIGTLLDTLYTAHLSLPVRSIDTQVWKNAVLDDRSATKERAIWYVKQITGKDVNDNVADAVCLGIAGWNTRITQTVEQ